ncbi:MAG: nucleoside recognition domain-containing protein [Clostridiaceae bacterium]
MDNNQVKLKRAISSETFIFLFIFLGFFCTLGFIMGGVNMINTLIGTAYQLLMDTVFYILAAAVVAGAISSLLSEFGVIALINKVLSPLMKPIYGLPGAASMGIIATYVSDNPAILPLANDKNFRRYFKKYQLPALTNLGTAFGMGLIVTAFIIGIPAPYGESFVLAAVIGNLGAIIGSFVSTRLMLRHTSRVYGTAEYCDPADKDTLDITNDFRVVRDGNVGLRAINSLLEGGKLGVTLGFDIIPGVLIICTLVLMLTNGPSASGIYTGEAFQGVAFFPWIGEKLSFILKLLFGFTSAEAVAVPITALGAAGAAIGLIPKLVEAGKATGVDIAVFTAMCMCWSGYLSTHVAMMDSLKARELTGRAILSHTIGGISAGVAAHLLYKGILLLGSIL